MLLYKGPITKPDNDWLFLTHSFTDIIKYDTWFKESLSIYCSIIFEQFCLSKSFEDLLLHEHIEIMQAIICKKKEYFMFYILY